MTHNDSGIDLIVMEDFEKFLILVEASILDYTHKAWNQKKHLYCLVNANSTSFFIISHLNFAYILNIMDVCR